MFFDFLKSTKNPQSKIDAILDKYLFHGIAGIFKPIDKNQI
jgi:hypothetical protein